jgi:hypothetical protein
MPPSLCCAQASLYCAQVFIATLEPIHGRSPSNPAANFALTGKNYFCLAQIYLAKIYRGRRTPAAGLTQQASDGKPIEQARTLPFRSTLYFGATSLINVLFFPCEVE